MGSLTTATLAAALATTPALAEKQTPEEMRYGGIVDTVAFAPKSTDYEGMSKDFVCASLEGEEALIVVAGNDVDGEIFGILAPTSLYTNTINGTNLAENECGLDITGDDAPDIGFPYVGKSTADASQIDAFIHD